MGELLKRGYWSNWWMELGGRKKTSGSILKHFLSCRSQLPYIWGHIPQESGIRAGGSLNDN